jgi:hypothetical protein
MPATLSELNISADFSFRELQNRHPEYYEFIFDILGDKERTKTFQKVDCVWKGFINQKFCFVIVSVRKDDTIIMELYHNKDAVLLIFSNCEDNKTTIWEITCVHNEYMPFTDFIMKQFIELSTENKNTAIIIELRKGQLQFDSFFLKHQFNDSVRSDKDIIKSWRKELHK